MACSNKSRTLLAPTPTNISTNSAPEIEKNGTSASPETARANNVFPVPGGPNSKTPLGILPPNFWNLDGSLRNSTISCNSYFASSQPATSVNITLPPTSFNILILAFPKESIPFGPPPPPCILLITNIYTAIKAIHGKIEMTIPHQGLSAS